MSRERGCTRHTRESDESDEQHESKGPFGHGCRIGCRLEHADPS